MKKQHLILTIVLALALLALLVVACLPAEEPAGGGIGLLGVTCDSYVMETFSVNECIPDANYTYGTVFNTHYVDDDSPVAYIEPPWFAAATCYTGGGRAPDSANNQHALLRYKNFTERTGYISAHVVVTITGALLEPSLPVPLWLSTVGTDTWSDLVTWTTKPTYGALLDSVITDTLSVWTVDASDFVEASLDDVSVSFVITASRVAGDEITINNVVEMEAVLEVCWLGAATPYPDVDSLEVIISEVLSSEGPTVTPRPTRTPTPAP
jgi:hypothetical protein